MKSLKRILAIALSVLMVASFAGCSGNGNSSTASTTDTSSAGTSSSADSSTSSSKAFKIGYNYFGNAPVLVTLGNNSKYVVEAFGGTATSMDDQFSADKIIQDIENLISLHVDGLVVWAPADALYPTISKMCLEAKIPFVLADKIPSDSKIKDQLLQNPYFVGGVAPKNADYGSSIAKYAIEKGYKTCIVNTSPVGDPSDQPRFDAFKKEFEAAGGKILDVVHTSGTDGGVAQMENSLVAHPNPDFVYGVGSSFGTGAVKALAKYSYKTKVITSGLEEEVLNNLSAGKIEMANGDNWVSGTYAAVLLQNYLDGNKLLDKDGKAPVLDNVGFYQVTSNQVDLYKKCFISETTYSADEIKQMNGKTDKNFNYDAFVKVITDYSLENRMAQKVKEGKVTKDELAAVGIKIN